MIKLKEKMSKRCGCCRQEKSSSEFHKNRTRPCGYQQTCKECAKNSRRINKTGRKTKLKQKYNLTLDQYEFMSTIQNHVCAICQKPESAKQKGTTRFLSVDHCHATSKIRGLLCFECNIGLGKFKDDTQLLTKAIAYLKK